MTWAITILYDNDDMVDRVYLAPDEHAAKALATLLIRNYFDEWVNETDPKTDYYQELVQFQVAARNLTFDEMLDGEHEPFLDDEFFSWTGIGCIFVTEVSEAPNIDQKLIDAVMEKIKDGGLHTEGKV